MKFKGYTITEKKDFGAGGGHYIDGFFVKHGYVVTDGGIVNVMPGATWFLTVRDAKEAIKDLIAAGDSAEQFWKLQGMRKMHRENFDRLAEPFECTDDNPFGRWDINAYNLAQVIKIKDGPDRDGREYRDGRHQETVANVGFDGQPWEERNRMTRAICVTPEALALARKVARLNAAAGEIGAGMLANLVAEAREIIERADKW